MKPLMHFNNVITRITFEEIVNNDYYTRKKMKVSDTPRSVGYKWAIKSPKRTFAVAGPLHYCQGV